MCVRFSIDGETVYQMFGNRMVRYAQHACCFSPKSEFFVVMLRLMYACVCVMGGGSRPDSCKYEKVHFKAHGRDTFVFRNID